MDSRPEQKPKLLDQVRNRMRALHRARSTQKCYIRWLTEFILFHNKRHPTEMGTVEINEFLTHLAVKRNISASS